MDHLQTESQLRAIVFDHIIKLGHGGRLSHAQIGDDSLLSACGIDSLATVRLLIGLAESLTLALDRVHDLRAPSTVGDVIRIVARAKQIQG